MQSNADSKSLMENSMTNNLRCNKLQIQHLLNTLSYRLLIIQEVCSIRDGNTFCHGLDYDDDYKIDLVMTLNYIYLIVNICNCIMYCVIVHVFDMYLLYDYVYTAK